MNFKVIVFHSIIGARPVSYCRIEPFTGLISAEFNALVVRRHSAPTIGTGDRSFSKENVLLIAGSNRFVFLRPLKFSCANVQRQRQITIAAA
jgi:hypothetical protein